MLIVGRMAFLCAFETALSRGGGESSGGHLVDVDGALDVGLGQPQFDVVVDAGRGQHRLERVRPHSVDDVAVGLQHPHHFGRPAVPDEHVAAVRARHDVVVAPERRLVDDRPAFPPSLSKQKTILQQS